MTVTEEGIKGAADRVTLVPVLGMQLNAGGGDRGAGPGSPLVATSTRQQAIGVQQLLGGLM